MTNRTIEVDDFVEAFEQVRTQDKDADLANFLPPAGHPLYADVLVELVRADLHYCWQKGPARSLVQYLVRFPELNACPNRRSQVAFEEYRLRCRAGQQPSLDEYRRRYAVRVEDWPIVPDPSDTPTMIRKPPVKGNLTQAAREYRQLTGQASANPIDLNSWCDSWGESAEQAHLFRDLHRANPEAAQKLSAALTTLPEPGSEFLGFTLVEELGQGAFGKVFLAQQGELAHRQVALKVATDLLGESQTLAQLQHTNIVPIYSVHCAAPFQAVCMPYCGRITLADVLASVIGAQSLPGSGKSLVSTLRNRQSRTMRSGRAGTGTSSEPISPSRLLARSEEKLDAADLPTVTGPALEKLEGMTYVAAILYLAARLADGLAHAHDRGILHRDLKPANVLLSDDGTPMLLDFNLSQDTKIRNTPEAASIGGTLPYMAPEHMESIRDGKNRLDPRSDIYAFGIILAELLTGRAPFAQHRGRNIATIIDNMLEERWQGAPRLRQHNKLISPAVESIVRHCLEPDPTQRYQNAHQLREDIERHLEDKPLLYAPEPSLSERMHKWVRRHPRMASWQMLAAVAFTLVLTTTSIFAFQFHHARQVRLAQSAYQATQEDLQTARFLLNSHAADESKRQLGLAAAERILSRHEVLARKDWLSVSSYLSLSQQRRLKEDMGELLWLTARGSRHSSTSEELHEALRRNTLAESCYAPDEVPPSVWRQRAELQRRLGQPDEAQRWSELADAAMCRSARDLYLTATEYLAAGQPRQALPLLQEAIKSDPRHFWAWFMQGVCQSQLEQVAEAKASYAACSALWPEYPWSHYNRGLLALRNRDYPRARADFDEAIHRRDDQPEMYLNRALAYHGLGEPTRAIDDLNCALELGASPCRVYFMRARIYSLSGNKTESVRNRALGLKFQPEDEHDWVARGLAQLPENPEAAALDFKQALGLNPRSLAALQNLAHVQADSSGQLGEAVKTLTRVVELYPDYVPARSGRGVLLARMGQRKEALADAQESLRRDTSPRIAYQVAGVYALMSSEDSAERREALRLLSLALRQGFGFDLLADDPDLAPLRQMPEFAQLVEAAKSMR